MRLALLLSVASIAVLLGAMSAAWKRAILEMARTFFSVRFASRLSPAEQYRFAPPFTANLLKFALFLFFLTAVIGGWFFGWVVGLAAFFGVWLLSELIALVFPRRSNPYYARQAIADLASREAMYSNLGEAAIATDLRERREELETCFGLAAPTQRP